MKFIEYECNLYLGLSVLEMISSENFRLMQTSSSQALAWKTSALFFNSSYTPNPLIKCSLLTQRRCGRTRKRLNCIGQVSL